MILGHRVEREGKRLEPWNESQKADTDKALVRKGFTEKERKAVKWTGKYSGIIARDTMKERLPIKGRITETETETIMEMRHQDIHLRIIADALGRKERTIKAKIASYLRAYPNTFLHQGPQALSPELENSLFSSRLLRIWEELMTFPKTIR